MKLHLIEQCILMAEKSDIISKIKQKHTETQERGKQNPNSLSFCSRRQKHTIWFQSGISYYKPEIRCNLWWLDDKIFNCIRPAIIFCIEPKIPNYTQQC